MIRTLVPKGQSSGGQDQDDTLFIPFSTAQKRLLGIAFIHGILATATSSEAVRPALEQITTLLRQRHRLRPG